MMASESEKALSRVTEMLPPAYELERRLRHVVRVWTAAICILLAVLTAMFIAISVRIHQESRSVADLTASTMPLLDLRRDIENMRVANQRRTRWCEWVESARPADDAFQTLASIIVSAESDGSDIKLDQVAIRVPVEFSADLSETPEWAEPRVSVSARVKSVQRAQQWTESLSLSDRLFDVQSATDEKVVEVSGRYEFQAVPTASRVCP